MLNGTDRSGIADRRLWAFQMLDATSVGDSGFINRFVYFGDYDLCLSVSAPNDQFHGQHCLVRLDFSLPPPAVKDSIPRVDLSNTTMQDTWLEQCASVYKYMYLEKITTGICMPSTCQPKMIEHALNDGERVSFAFNKLSSRHLIYVICAVVSTAASVRFLFPETCDSRFSRHFSFSEQPIYKKVTM